MDISYEFVPQETFRDSSSAYHGSVEVIVVERTDSAALLARRANSRTKVFEYLNLGTPAVVTLTPEQAYVAGEGGGGLVAEYTADSFRQLLENPDLAAAMGAAGQSFVRKHRSYDLLLESVTERYERLLEGA
jgi:glycosyltransferase involved in cell wall biosynthesis